MKFEETHVSQGWRKIITPYRQLQDSNHFGFVIEAPPRFPEHPHLWLEGNDAVIHHSPGLFIVLPDLAPFLIDEIINRETLMISETYGSRGDGLMPWGMDRSASGGRIYEVRIFHTEAIGDIRKIFNGMRDPESQS
jgi:hypothetical protein